MSKKSVKQVRRKHSHEFRQNAISMVEDQGYTTTQAARELGINQNLLRTWRKKYGKAAESSGLSENDQEELDRLRKENSRLRMERDILKKATAFFANEKN
jgi:transposase